MSNASIGSRTAADVLRNTAEAASANPAGPSAVAEANAELCYRVWSPDHGSLEVEIQPADRGPLRKLRLQRRPGGYHEVCDPQGREGDRYRFIVNGRRLPDPGSHAQSGDVHSWSVVVNHSSYPWKDAKWRRPAFRDLVIYELHVGTFTEEGTFRGAIGKLSHLQSLGINAIELMPIGDFAGERNWGYDGVLVYAPAHAYGTPDDLRALVDAIHEAGIAVILDVVYNHFGPDGNYLSEYSNAYFNPDRQTPWGPSINFDGVRSAGVRNFFRTNPIYWMEHYHMDGFRLDATHTILDDSDPHILQEIAQAVHSRGGYVIAEDARNDARLLNEPEEGGIGLDATWADDFHHVARVGQTRERESYYGNFQGTIAELVETMVHGWLYRGHRTTVDGLKLGTECRHLKPSKFVHCISNHDQAGNRAFGERINKSVSPEVYRALSMLLCLTPYTPMLFMGQEWATSTPFLYFTDHEEELGRQISLGRRREFAEFEAFRDPELLKQIPDPQAEETFLRSKLDWSEVEKEPHSCVRLLYQESLRLRRTECAFRPLTRESWRAERLSSDILGIRFEGESASYLLLVDPWGCHSGGLADEPVAEPGNRPWQFLLGSNEERFGGNSPAAFNSEKQHYSFTVPEALLLRREKLAG